MKRFFLVPWCLLILFSCKEKPAEPRVEEVLGTLCSVQAFSDGSDTLYDALFARLHQIDAVFSANRPDSELSALQNAAGDHAVSVSEALFFVLQTALQIAELTDGAFDPSIGPLVKQWGIATDSAHVPADQEITTALSLVNWRNVVLNEPTRTVFLTKKGMSLDLGGIAKGYAADELASILTAHKVNRAIIDLGGNIFVFGAKPDGSLWRVGIKNPENPSLPAAVALSLPQKSVVTSGVYERFFEQDGIRYHHILDAKTGFPARTALLSVTVVSDSSLLGDALSTALFVLGAERGLKLAQQQAVEAVFILEDHRIFSTDGIKQHLTVLTDDYVLQDALPVFSF